MLGTDMKARINIVVRPTLFSQQDKMYDRGDWRVSDLRGLEGRRKLRAVGRM